MYRERTVQVRQKFYSFFYRMLSDRYVRNERLYIIKQNTNELLEEKKEDGIDEKIEELSKKVDQIIESKTEASLGDGQLEMAQDPNASSF